MHLPGILHHLTIVRDLLEACFGAYREGTNTSQLQSGVWEVHIRRAMNVMMCLHSYPVQKALCNPSEVTVQHSCMLQSCCTSD